jgi:hypothetical protein
MLSKLLIGGASWLVLFTLTYYQAAAQRISSSDSLAVAAAVETATQQYVKDMQPESVLFNGPEYVNHTLPTTIGHQFFGSADPQPGTATYYNAHFQAIPLRYDLALDRVVLTYPNQIAHIVLVPEKLTSFSIGNQNFIRVVSDSLAGASSGVVLPTGFYELLQAGPVSLLARHTKYLQQTTVGQSLQFEFKQLNKLFARTSSTAVEVGRLKDLLALLPSHKPEVQRYARQQKLRFSAGLREESALKVLRYYYTLPQ